MVSGLGETHTVSFNREAYPEVMYLEDKQNVNDSETGANAYAIDNMYRKDRRELIKNSDLNNERIKKAKESLKKEDGVYNIKDDYLIGLDKFSKKKYFDY